MTWQPLYDNWLYWLLGAVIVGIILLARRIAVAPKLRSWLFLGLRLMTLGAVAALLLNPIDRRETNLPPRPASVALVIDCSQSMVLGQPQPRLEQVKRMIDEASRSLPGDAGPRISLYRFGEYLAQAPGLTEINATDDSSQLAVALERLPSRFSQDVPRAIVVFSDGAIEQPELLPALAAAYAEMGVEVHVFGPSEEDLRGDVGITELAVPARVTEGDVATIQATINSSGFAGNRVVLAVRPSDRENAPPIATLPITLENGPQSCELVVNVDADLGGLTLEIPVLPGEAVGENNRVPFRLTERNRKLKVLYMEGTAGGEYRWLQDALQEDSDIECVSMTVNDQYSTRPRLQRVEDPYRGYPATRAELFEYDVVICSDISQAAYTPDQINWTVELVAERGGGFAMVGGHTAFGSGGWDRTEWEKLIPFDMTGHRNYLATNFTVRVPVEAELHPIWQIVDDPRDNRRVLDSIPQFRGTNLITRVKPAATLLGETASPLPQIGIMPVFACESFGRGRTFAMSSDTTVDWGRYFESKWGEGDNRYFRKFWRNVVRWLSENSRSAELRLLVETDQVIYSPGDQITISAEAFDENLEPTTDYRLTAQLVPEDMETADTTPPDLMLATADLSSIAAQQRYSGELAARLPTDLDDPTRVMQPARILVTAWNGDEEVATSEISIQLLHNSREWIQPQSRPENLAALADAGGGRRLESSQELTELLRRFEPASGEVLTHSLPLWDRPLFWGILLGLLGLEWALRRMIRHAAPAT